MINATMIAVGMLLAPVFTIAILMAAVVGKRWSERADRFKEPDLRLVALNHDERASVSRRKLD